MLRFNTMPAMRPARILVPTIAALAAGCGGGGGAGTSPGGSGPGGSGPGQTANVGTLSVAFTGKPQAVIEGSNSQVAVIGQSGASYSTISDSPVPNLSSTMLAFTRGLQGGDQIYTMPFTPNGTATLLANSSVNGLVTWANNGTLCFLTLTAGLYEIFTIKSDGSSPHMVYAVEGAPSISPNGATVAYTNVGNNALYSIPVSGGTPKLLYNSLPVGSVAVWNAAGNQLAFSAKTSAGNYNVFTMASTGGAATNVTPSALQSTGDSYVNAWSPDGKTLAVSYTPTSGNSSIMTLNLVGGATNVLSPATFADYYPAISPDGRQIAFYRDSTGGAVPGIYVSDFAEANPQLILPDPSSAGNTGGLQQLSWSPFLQKQTFVGSGGTIGSAAVSGFLIAQAGNQFGSFLTFTTTTASTATIASPATPPGNGPLLYSLGGDAITNVSFTNVYYGAHTSMPLTSTPNVEISVDGTTGQINFVAPALAGHRTPAVVHSGGSQVSLQGQFAAIYDATGKNVAPSGASTIVVDRSTGKLLSFR